MMKNILVTGGAGFISAGRFGTFQSCQERSSDINNNKRHSELRGPV